MFVSKCFGFEFKLIVYDSNCEGQMDDSNVCFCNFNAYLLSSYCKLQYLKQLIDDMQAMKLEMNKIRVASSSVGTTRARSDSLRINLKELRSDIDAIRARMAMTPRVSKH